MQSPPEPGLGPGDEAVDGRLAGVGTVSRLGSGVAVTPWLRQKPDGPGRSTPDDSQAISPETDPDIHIRYPIHTGVALSPQHGHRGNNRHEPARITSDLVMHDVLTDLLTNRFDLDQPGRYVQGRRPPSAGVFGAVGSWLTRKRSPDLPRGPDFTALGPR